MSDDVKDVHFRFGNDEKFIINHEGDAEFIGKVTVDPGREGHEVVTYQQLLEVEQEIEDLRPSIERGSWQYAGETQSAGGGEYAIFGTVTEDTCGDEYVNCINNATSPQEVSECARIFNECSESEGQPKYGTWSFCHTVQFSTTDYDSNNHTFLDITEGLYCEINNIDGDGNGLFQIKKVYDVQLRYITLQIQHISSYGRPGAIGKVKFFDLTTADPADFVKKAGDTMTGPLVVTGRTTDSSPSLLLKPTDSAGANSDALKVFNKDGDTQFYVTIGGDISARDGWSPTKDKHLTTKKYLAKELRNSSLGSPYKYRPSKSPSSLANGEFTYDDDGDFYAARHDAAGNRIGSSTSDYFTADGMFKVYRDTGDYAILVVLRRYEKCRCGQSSNNHMLWEKRDANYTHTEWLIDGETYWLSDGYLLPH